MKTSGTKPRCDRFADASGCFVAEDDCGEHIFPIGAGTLGHSERAGDEGRAGMHDVAQVAIVRGRGVAHHGIDLRGIGQRQFRARREPHGGLRAPAALASKGADDFRGHCQENGLLDRRGSA